MAVGVDTLDFAEAPLAYVHDEPDGEVDASDARFVLHHSPTSASADFGQVLRVRVNCLEDVDDAIAAARRWFTARGRHAFTWQIRESVNTCGLVSALRHRGLAYHGSESKYSIMVRHATAPTSQSSHDIRLAVTAADHVLGARILAESFGLSSEQTARLCERVSDPSRQRPGFCTFLGYSDGRPAARGSVAFTEDGRGLLLAGATLPWARSLGLHRAIVDARIGETRRRGGSIVVVHAGDQSRRNFERLDFETLDTITPLVDSAAQ